MSMSSAESLVAPMVDAVDKADNTELPAMWQIHSWPPSPVPCLDLQYSAGYETNRDV